MRTLNAFLAVSTLALGACLEPVAPRCDKNCERIVAGVAGRANATLSDIDKSRRRAVSLDSIDPSCKAAVSADVANCMVTRTSELPLPGDDCINMATEKLRQCARNTVKFPKENK